MSPRCRELFAELQQRLCEALEEREERARFREDPWTHEAGGGGSSRILTGGALFEKAGVNVADVHGVLTPRLAERLAVPPQPFRALGISVVIHPLTPMVPTTHMNLRYIALAERSWFGGGADLTPYYLYEEDAVHFHAVCRSVCDRHAPDYYARFKAWCDQYFFLKHRGETRGIGGIFFDYLEDDLERVFAFIQDVGRSFHEAYLPIVDRRRNDPWWDRERDWQLVRRGRYVEFNLIYDRGTLFGLETGGRTESILMSMPPMVRWVYDHHPAPGSREETLLRALQQPRDWLA